MCKHVVTFVDVLRMGYKYIGFNWGYDIFKSPVGNYVAFKDIDDYRYRSKEFLTSKQLKDYLQYHEQRGDMDWYPLTDNGKIEVTK